MKIQTGFKDLDYQLNGGFERPALIAIGGRPAMGKTSLLMDICRNFQKQNLDFLYVSLESSVDRLHEKSEGEIDKCKFINLKQDQDVFSLISILQDMKCRIVVIDYIQLLARSSKEDFYVEYTLMMNALKSYSLEYNATIIFSSQLTRKCEERPGHRPIMTDFRDSGVFEDICDIAIFVMRREYYDPMDKPGMAELIVAKNRFGGIGTVHLEFNKKEARFSDFNPKKSVIDRWS